MTKIFSRRNLKNYRGQLRHKMTKGEVLLWQNIKNDILGCRFRRQYSIGKYIADFYCPKLKLAIEVDGLTHLDKDVLRNDWEKQKYLENVGVKTLRFTSEQIFNQLDSVLKHLHQICQESETEASATPPTPSW